jgi:hypothetical protein
MAAALAGCNAFANGQTLILTNPPDIGMAKEDNLGLAFVHGSEKAAGSFIGDAHWERRRRQCRIRIGSTDAQRNFTV